MGTSFGCAGRVFDFGTTRPVANAIGYHVGTPNSDPSDYLAGRGRGIGGLVRLHRRALPARKHRRPSIRARARRTDFVMARKDEDAAAVVRYRPGNEFWQHVFTIPDGYIAYGSAVNGRLLVVFPTKGDWQTGADWKDPSLANLLDGLRLQTRLDPKRDQVAAILEQAVGPVLHNPTRGNFVRPNAERYRDVPQGVGHDLRALRRAGRHRALRRRCSSRGSTARGDRARAPSASASG